MAVQAIPLEESGLATVEDVAASYETAVRTVQRWIEDGRFPVHVVGSGKRTVYLIRLKDLKGFEKPPRGRPVEKTEASASARTASKRTKKGKGR